MDRDPLSDPLSIIPAVPLDGSTIKEYEVINMNQIVSDDVLKKEELFKPGMNISRTDSKATDPSFVSSFEQYLQKMKGVEKLFKHLDEPAGRSSRRKEARRRYCELPEDLNLLKKVPEEIKEALSSYGDDGKPPEEFESKYQVSIVYDGSQAKEFLLVWFF